MIRQRGRQQVVTHERDELWRSYRSVGSRRPDAGRRRSAGRRGTEFERCPRLPFDYFPAPPARSFELVRHVIDRVSPPALDRPSAGRLRTVVPGHAPSPGDAASGACAAGRRQSGRRCSYAEGGSPPNKRPTPSNVIRRDGGTAPWRWLVSGRYLPATLVLRSSSPARRSLDAALPQAVDADTVNRGGDSNNRGGDSK